MINFISVIIPARNSAPTIARAIESAWKAGADHVLVYDDASSDKTADILQFLFFQDNRLKYFIGTDVRTGVCGARNFLISKAPYGLIVPLDADDELSSLEPFRLTYQEDTWVYGGWIDVGANRSDVLKQYAAPAPGMLRTRPLCYATMCFHKKDWLRCGGYDPDLNLGAEDYGLQCALTACGVRPVCIPDVMHYRYVQESKRTDTARMYWPTLNDVIQNRYRVGV
jgi:glycosyltransferase involved in cell wall biosynthesis